MATFSQLIVRWSTRSLLRRQPLSRAFGSWENEAAGLGEAKRQAPLCPASRYKTSLPTSHSAHHTIHHNKTLFQDFFSSQFGASTTYIEYKLVEKIKAEYPQQQHLIVVDTENSFPVPAFLKGKGIETQVTENYRTHFFDYATDTISSQVKIGAVAFTWSETDFILHKFTWPNRSYGVAVMYALIFRGHGDTKPGEDLLQAAYKWNMESLDNELFVFVDGRWTKDKKLWASVQMADCNNLVLDTQFIAGLKRDTDTFFSNRAIYESLGIPWKRGLLLLGPPGNGKTESIKVLLKESGIPSLYVRSFAADEGSETGIRSIFEFARRQAPCILVLEDLDSMVTPDIRAFFLNELDGLEQNDGILTVATSNHPELIDDAILNRPSRFDVKYTFNLPTPELRRAYIEKWTIKVKKLLPSVDFTDVFISEMTKETEGFSFAFMKELFVSFLLRIAHDKVTGKGEPGTGEEVMRDQIKQLQEQIETGKKEDQDQEESTPDYFRSEAPGYLSRQLMNDRADEW